MQSTSATKAKGHFWGSGNKIKQITISQTAHLCQAGVKFPRFKVFFIAERDINALQSYFESFQLAADDFSVWHKLNHHFWISDTRFKYLVRLPLFNFKLAKSNIWTIANFKLCFCTFFANFVKKKNNPTTNFSIPNSTVLSRCTPCVGNVTSYILKRYYIQHSFSQQRWLCTLIVTLNPPLALCMCV